MKTGSRKLALQRETLVALTPDALDAVAGGNRSVTLPQTRGLSVCPSRLLSVCPTTHDSISISAGGGQGGGQ